MMDEVASSLGTNKGSDAHNILSVAIQNNVAFVETCTFVFMQFCVYVCVDTHRHFEGWGVRTIHRDVLLRAAQARYAPPPGRALRRRFCCERREGILARRLNRHQGTSVDVVIGTVIIQEQLLKTLEPSYNFNTNIEFCLTKMADNYF